MCFVVVSRLFKAPVFVVNNSTSFISLLIFFFQDTEDLLGMGRYSATPTPQPLGSRLGERGRSDWRRISVPERGKDFKSLPRKYNR